MAHDDMSRVALVKLGIDLVIKAGVRALQARQPTLTKSDALATLFREDPELYEKYRAANSLNSVSL